MMKRTFVASLLVARVAAADELAGAPPAPPDEPTMSITTSPVHLIIPMVELTAELRVSSRVGIAAIAGAGGFRDEATNAKVHLYEGGVSARYYATGSFRSGLQLGVEAAYIKADASDEVVEVKAAGLGISPFAGYKWMHRSGLTLEGQLGATFMVVRAKADTGEMAEDSAVAPMLNLNIGYSF